MTASWEKFKATRDAHLARQKAQGARDSRSQARKRGLSPKELKARARERQTAVARDMAIADAVCAGFWAMGGCEKVSCVAVGLGMQAFFFAAQAFSHSRIEETP